MWKTAFLRRIKWGGFPTIWDVFGCLFFYSPGTRMPHKTGGFFRRSDLTGLLLILSVTHFYLPISLPSESRWWKEARNKSQRTIQEGENWVALQSLLLQNVVISAGSAGHTHTYTHIHKTWAKLTENLFQNPDKREHTDNQVRQWSFSSQNMH